MNSFSEGIADEGWFAEDSVAKLKGSWPFRASGTPTTQLSAMSGWDAMVCSIKPGTYDQL